MLTSNVRYILKNDEQKLKMHDMQTEISANRKAIYALEEGLSPIEERLAEALRASNDEASSLRSRNIARNINTCLNSHLSFRTDGVRTSQKCVCIYTAVYSQTLTAISIYK